MDVGAEKRERIPTVPRCPGVPEAAPSPQTLNFSVPSPAATTKGKKLLASCFFYLSGYAQHVGHLAHPGLPIRKLT